MGLALAIGTVVLDLIGWLLGLVWWIGCALEPIVSAIFGDGGGDPARECTIRRLAGPGRIGRRIGKHDREVSRRC